MSNNIDLNKVKEIAKKNVISIALIIFDVVLLLFIFSKQEQTSDIERQIDEISIKENLASKQIATFKDISSQLKTYQGLESSLYEKCFNFGSRTALYKFLLDLGKIADSKTSNIAISSAYDLNKGTTIDLNQDTSEYNGDKLIVSFSLNLQSTFSTLHNFIKALQKQNYFINISQLNIKENVTVTDKKKDEATQDPSVPVIPQEPNISATLIFNMLGKIEQMKGDHV